MGNEKRPKIRFPEFTDDWEQRKLSELCVITTGYPFDSKDFSDDGEYLVITNGNIQDESDTVKNSVGNHITVKNENILSSYLLDIGDILVTMDGTVGRTAKVVENGQILAQRVGRIKALANGEFLYQWLNTGAFSKAMLELSHGGTIKHISLEEIRSFESAVPNNLDEQKKIADLLANLDRTITLHQRKLESTKKLKKSMLQKMFPKEGEDIPEVRFPEFTDSWEQRKLLDTLIQPVSDGPHETPDLVEEGIPFISVDAIVDNRIDFNRKRGYISEEYDLECRKKYSPQRDDVYLVKSGATVGKVAIVETDIRFNIWSPLAAMRTNKKIMLPKYLYYYLQLKDVQDEIYEKSIGGTQPNLSMRVLERFNITFPNIDEQSKIIGILNGIDNLITLHQRKCTELKRLKTYLLQNMFA